MSFHSKMIKLRKIKGLTQENFAAEIGVSRQSVYKWESGQSYPDVEKLLKIARTFGVTVDDMLNDEMDVDRQGVMRPAAEVQAEEERIAKEKEERRRRRAENKARREAEAAAAAEASVAAEEVVAEEEVAPAVEEASAAVAADAPVEEKKGGFFGLFRRKK
ncbi:MAG: helix-turn-helix transcriptional regulator [Ruminococcaceae bacterium]|nr:helix-turn-helix transcriptional regulator [Oscillospiraceae bacterium]